MKSMQIFEPPMCCPTGLCGVSTDPELLRIATVIHTLEKNGVKVERFNLTNNPMKFLEYPVVGSWLKEFGTAKLPLVLVDGEVAITGRYPTNAEFVRLLGCDPSLLNTGSCCCCAPAPANGGGNGGKCC